MLSHFAIAVTYDVVIKNGRVMDPETSFDAIANVGVLGGKIAEITTESITGTETIDASGHIVSPGFIDTHAHGVDPFSSKLYLLDGLTTPMDMELGARDVDKWYRERAGKSQVNYATTVSHTLARIHVMDGDEAGLAANDIIDLDAAVEASQKTGRRGWSQLASKEELDQLMAYMDKGLRQGAIGIGNITGHLKEAVTAAEQYRVQELAGKYGRVTDVHSRFIGILPPTTGAIGIQESLANAVALDAPLLMAHLNPHMEWEFTIPLINTMREKVGVKVWGEVYPWGAGSGLAGSATIAEKQMRSMGMTYSDITTLDGTPWTKEMYDDKRVNHPGERFIGYMNPPEDIVKWLAMPGVTIISDGGSYKDKDNKPLAWDAPYENALGHPRGAGSRGKVLRLVRETKNMPLMEAISKMSYMHAKYLAELGGIMQFNNKGRLQKGKDADIVVFDPKTVTENSTYKLGEGALPSSGIPYVLVNGVIVVKDSVVQKVYPGKPIRFDVIN